MNDLFKSKLSTFSTQPAIIISIVAHTSIYIALITLSPTEKSSKIISIPIKVAISETTRPEKTIAPPKPKRQLQPTSLRTNKKQSPQPTTQPKPVQGLLNENFAPNSTGPRAAVGNTLMKEDSGERLSANDVTEYVVDQTRDAIPITNTIIKPDYTDAALDAGAEGLVEIDVYVSAEGQVEDAELRKRFGYGMDERILQSARTVRFQPRLDRYGKSISGWAILKMRLILE